MVNWKFKLIKMEETSGKLKPLFKSLEKLTTVSLNNVDFVRCRETQGRHEPLFLKCLLKYLPNIKHLSILKSELAEEQVSTIVKALKYRVKRNDITLHTKHVTQSGVDELLSRLSRSKMTNYQYDSQTGVLEVFQPRAEPILKRMKSLKSVKIRGFYEIHKI